VDGRFTRTLYPEGRSRSGQYPPARRVGFLGKGLVEDTLCGEWELCEGVQVLVTSQLPQIGEKGGENSDNPNGRVRPEREVSHHPRRGVT
jgi:hypothetical protein